MLTEPIIEAIVKKYIDSKEVIAIGTSESTPALLKKFALLLEEKDITAYFVPTSTENAMHLGKLGLKTKDINTTEIDLAIEFVDKVDKDFSFIKRDSLSLVRDKMIAKSAEEMIVVANENDYVNKINGKVPVEITNFGWKKTLLHLQSLGKAELRKGNNAPFTTETGHYLVDLEFDSIYTPKEIDYFAKDIPGVLETGFFIGYCDRIITLGDTIKIRSRLDWEEQNKENEIVLFRNKPV